MSLPLLPSLAEIILGVNDNLAQHILQIFLANGLHLPPKHISSAAAFLWIRAGNGAFDRQYSSWAPRRVNCQMKDRVETILDHHSVPTQYQTPLQVLTRQIVDARTNALQEGAAVRTKADRRKAEVQAANNHFEGQLGLLPPTHGVGVPTDEGAGPALREQMGGAAGLLAGKPRSQNNGGEQCMFEMMGYEDEWDYLEHMEEDADATMRRFFLCN